jgi:hypothetical protein
MNGLKSQSTMVSELENSVVTELSNNMLKKSGKSLLVKLLNKPILVAKDWATLTVLPDPKIEQKPLNVSINDSALLSLIVFTLFAVLVAYLISKQ